MRSFVIALLCLGLAGCTFEEVQPIEPQEPFPTPQGVDTVHQGNGDLVGDPPAPEVPWATRRRMNIDQLDASIQRVVGLAWEDAQGDNQFEELAATLGKPDFIDATQEDLTVSLLFQKFLGDAARDVCARRAEGEADGTLPPLLMELAGPEITPESDPAAVDANLQQLLLRFHGQDIAPESERMAPWRWLFTSSVHVTGEPVTAWRAVCVGLLTHPDFYSY